MNKFIAVLTIINSILIVLLFSLIIENSDYLVEKYWELERDISELKYEAKLSDVDFSSKQIQQVSERFFIVGAEQEEHLTGVKFKGRIINSTALDHSNIEFVLSSAGKEKEFSISKISSGNSTGFDVYLPDVDPAKVRYATIRYVSSSISYLIK